MTPLETDPVVLMQTIRSHPHFRMHGPEHHAMVPAVILTALRNRGCFVTHEQFTTAIQRGQTIGGGSCAFCGACGAAIGVGVATSLLLGATPYDADKRQAAQKPHMRFLEPSPPSTPPGAANGIAGSLSRRPPRSSPGTLGHR